MTILSGPSYGILTAVIFPPTRSANLPSNSLIHPHSIIMYWPLPQQHIGMLLYVASFPAVSPTAWERG